MSLAIDVDLVDAVLLADGWHPVNKASFTLDAYEYREGSINLLGGGQCAQITSVGFTFLERLDSGSIARVFGPLTSVLAVQYAGGPPP